MGPCFVWVPAIFGVGLYKGIPFEGSGSFDTHSHQRWFTVIFERAMSWSCRSCLSLERQPKTNTACDILKRQSVGKSVSRIRASDTQTHTQTQQASEFACLAWGWHLLFSLLKKPRSTSNRNPWTLTFEHNIFPFAHVTDQCGRGPQTLHE